MVKFMILFYKTAHVNAFENLYNDFLALVERMPDIQRRQVIDVLGSPVGETRLHRILEVYFDTYDQMQAALQTPAGQEAGAELTKFPPGSFELVFAEVYEEVGGQTKAS
jgi:uncharacterized protein (TIGR02118 family)